MPRFPEEHWQTLTDKIQDGTCTPFIGAGACAGTLPLGHSLAEQLAASLRRPLTEPSDLQRVAQYLAVERRDNAVPKRAVAKIVKTATPPRFEGDEPHAALAHIGAAIYLTTNYDDFMFQALAAKQVHAVREACRWTPSLLRDEYSVFDDGFAPSRKSPVVFHVHGGVGLHDNRSIVVTEDDYLDFLVNISKDLAQNPKVAGQPAMLPLAIRAAIKSSTLLFVGYSLADIDFRVVLRGLVGSLEPSHRVLNVAVQIAPNNPQRSLEELEQVQTHLQQYFEWTLNIQIYWADAREFARELRTRLGKTSVA